MNAMTTFDFQEQAVRVVAGPDGEPWFVGRDVTTALALVNGPQAIGRLDVDEKGIYSIDTLGGAQDMLIVSEPGVWQLVFTSRTPAAAAFKRWLAHEVLPALRKTGKYEMAAATSDNLIAGCERDVARDWLGVIREARTLFGKGAARVIWAQSPLPQPMAAMPVGVAAQPDQDGLAFLAALLASMPGPLDGKSVAEALEALDGDDRKGVAAALARCGLAVRGGMLAVSNTHPVLNRLFADTAWSGRWPSALRKVPGVEASTHPIKFNGWASRAAMVPLALCVEDGE